MLGYRFLRRVENRLQMEQERQIHRLPTTDEARLRLARSLGFASPEAFDTVLDGHREAVRGRFEQLFSEGSADQVLALFARNAPGLLRTPGARGLVEDLAGRFAREIEEAADPALALNNLDRFIEGIGSRRFYYGLLADRPELVPRLAALFGASRFLSAFLARHPDLIEPVFRDPDVLLLSREQLQADLAEVRAELARRGTGSDDVETELAAIRFFQHRQLVNVGLLDLDARIDPDQVGAALTDIAEVCLEAALAAAAGQLASSGRSAPEGAFLVVGMGKLGSRELGYGSDLDVIFLYDGPDDAGETQEYFTRLAQKLVWVLSVRTAEGASYEVDARLRPSGNQGVLVTSVDGFESYHEKIAEVWERQALLRARPVAGSERLAERFEALRRQVLARPLPEDLAAQIDHLRKRMESELSREGEGLRDFKTGRGGLVDVEAVVQYLQLRNGEAHPELWQPVPIAAQIDRLEAAGLLPADDAATLRDGWAFLQRLSSRMRIVENRSISEIDEERGTLDSVTRALGYRESQRGGGARRPLLEDYRRHTEGIRGVYARMFSPG